MKILYIYVHIDDKYWGSNPSLDTNFSLNVYHLYDHRYTKFSILMSFRTRRLVNSLHKVKLNKILTCGLLSSQNCNIVLSYILRVLDWNMNERERFVSELVYVSWWTDGLSRRCVKSDIWGSNPILDTNFSLYIWHLYTSIW